MNIEQFKAIAGEAYSNLKDTKIVFLKDDSNLLKLINDGVIATFENGAEILARTEKTREDKSIVSSRRPYLICFNQTLRCNVLYFMTGNKSKKIIKEKKYYEAREIPQSLYSHIDSVVKGGLDRTTHDDDKIPTASEIVAIPIPMGVADFSEIHTSDLENKNLNPAVIPELRDFLSPYYLRGDKNFITRATKSGRAYEWKIDYDDRISYHKMSRPASIYTALFINYALNTLSEEGATQNALALTQLKSITQGACKVYLDYLRRQTAMDNVRRLDPLVYRGYMQVKNDIAKYSETRGYGEAYIDALARLRFSDETVNDVKKLIVQNQEIDASFSTVVNSAIAYFNGLNRRVNISDVQMSESLFSNLYNIANTPSDEEYAELVEKWNDGLGKKFDDKISEIQTALNNARKAKEQEEHRKRIERETYARHNLSKLEQVKCATVDAIRLYNQLYKKAFKSLSDGELFRASIQENAKTFKKLFTTYEDKSSLNLKKLLGEPSEREAQKFISDRIIGMSDFSLVVEELREGISQCDKAKAMQRYAKSRGSRIAGDEGERVERAIELMSIVHSEFEKASNMKGKPSDKSTVEIIIEKVLKEKDKFYGVDFSNGTSERAYFDEMLLVSELQSQLANITNIFGMRLEALNAMREIEENYTTLVDCFQEVKDKLVEVNDVFSGEFERIFTKTPVDEFMTRVESEIMAYIQDKTTSAEDTAKNISEYKKSIIEAMEAEGGAIMGFVEANNKSAMYYNDFGVKYNEDESNLGLMVENAKKAVGFASDEGFMEGLLCGRGVVLKTDTNTGEVTREVKDEEERPLTDYDFVRQVFIQTIPQPSDIEQIVQQKLSEANNIFEATTALRYLGNLAKSWSQELTESYNAVRNLYITLLSYKKKMKENRDRYNKYYEKFVTELNPSSSLDGRAFLDEESLARLRDYAMKTLQTYKDHTNGYYDWFSEEFATGVVNYFNEIDQRTNAMIPAHDYVNVGRIVGNLPMRDMLTSEKMGSLELIKSQEERSKVLSDLVDNGSFVELVSASEFADFANWIVPAIEFEIELTALKDDMAVIISKTQEDANSVLVRRDELKASANTLLRISKVNETNINQIYDYIVKRIGEYRKVAVKANSKARRGMGETQDPQKLYGDRVSKQERLYYGSMSLSYDSGDSEDQQVKRANAFYRYWLGRLRDIERYKSEKGEELIERPKNERNEQAIMSGDYSSL